MLQRLVHAGQFADHAVQPRDFALRLMQLELQALVFSGGFAQLPLEFLDAVLAIVGLAERGRRQLRLRGGGGQQKKSGRGEARREPGNREQRRRSGHGLVDAFAVGPNLGDYDTAPETIWLWALRLTLHASSLARGSSGRSLP